MSGPVRVPPSGGATGALVAVARGVGRSERRDPRCYIASGRYDLVDNELVYTPDTEDEHVATCDVCTGRGVEAPLTARVVLRREDGRPA